MFAAGQTLDLPAATAITMHMRVRRNGRTVDARLTPKVKVTASPRFAFEQQLSGDGRSLFVRPDGFLKPGTRYRLRVRDAGGIDSTVEFTTAKRKATTLPPLEVGHTFRISRLAVPEPAFLTSINQIGFDSYDLTAATIARSGNRVLLWVYDKPGGDFAFPISGRISGDSLILSRADLNLTFSFGEVPARRFELRGQMRPDGRMIPGSSLWIETVCKDVPNYGGALQAIGLCNEDGILQATGTFLTSGAPDARKPALRVGTIKRSGDAVTASVSGGTKGHALSIALVDARTGVPVALDYVKATTVSAGSVSVAVPAGKKLRAYVVADGAVLATRDLP